MIYDRLKVKSATFSMDLVFDAKITIVGGNSAIGKTYLCSLLKELSVCPDYSNIVIFDYRSKNSLTGELKKLKNKFIVIDNADVILTDEDKYLININNGNQYLLFARVFDGLNLTLESFKTLKLNANTFYIREPNINCNSNTKQTNLFN